MTMQPIERFMRNGLRVSLYHDEDATSPRENDNLCTMVCKHRRYALGDKGAAEPPEDALAVLPLYLYDHSGLSISTGAFADRFDSGLLGFAYVTKARAETMGCVGTYTYEGVTKTWDREAYEDTIRGEVANYDDYLRGNNYGYVVETPEGEHLDSCWGFTGDLDYVRQEACSVADANENPEVDVLTARATYAGPYTAETGS